MDRAPRTDAPENGAVALPGAAAASFESLAGDSARRRDVGAVSTSRVTEVSIRALDLVGALLLLTCWARCSCSSRS